MKNGSASNANGRSKKPRPYVEPAGSLEASIVDLARSGALAKAAQKAIRRLRRKGLPITFQRGSHIIKQYADGREELLGIVKPVPYRIPKGVKIMTVDNGKT